MTNLIEYFSRNHTLSNVLFFGLILLSFFSWLNIGKEEMPEFESNWVRVTTLYPGAPAEDVELFVTKPLEQELKSVIGLKEIITTSSVGTSSIRITVEDDVSDIKEVVQEIKDAVLRTDLPSEVRDLPTIRQFRSAEKAILDVGIYHKDYKFLNAKARSELQKYVLSFEDQLLALKEISSVEKEYYHRPELQILIRPEKILNEEISLSEIQNQISNNNVRVPIGALNDPGESKVTAINELEDQDSLGSLILRGSYDKADIRLKEMATIQKGFRTPTSIFKINGHEGVFLNIRKNIATDILTAQKAVMNFIQKFKDSNKENPVGIILMDDESYAVTNRLDIVTNNGVLGFFLIIFVLFIFLNAKTGFWVGMGIPFSMAFTIIIAGLVGYTVNNMTLAGVIIVLGIVVDDAIIVAENIIRHKEQGMPITQAAIIGTTEMFRPIIASIVTTCVAFIPLMFFEGFLGKLVSYIPLIVILMLLGSLIESFLILPSHMAGKTPILDNFDKNHQKSWFFKIEKSYEKFLNKILNKRYLLITFAFIILAGAFSIYKTKMKFVMFPREESKEVYIKVKAPKNFNRFETAKAFAPLEQIFIDNKENVVGVRSSIAVSRRGGEVRENEGSILVELLPADVRPNALNDLMETWNRKIKEFKDLDVKILRGRWGHASGNAIELQVQENNDEKRIEITKLIEKKNKELDIITDFEIEEPLIKKEYLFKINQKKLIQFDVEPSAITTTLRSFVEGSILYTINKGDEEVDVRLSVPESAKKDLKQLLKLRIPNRAGRLTYLEKIVSIKEVKRPVNIKRNNFKRTTMIYGNPNPKNKMTPLEIAAYFEKNIFPSISQLYPSSILSFKGEIEDTRESQGEFKSSVMIVIIIIYLILVVMFNSLTKPLIVLSIVPFGIAGVIITFYLHGLSVFGFFAAIGALGMIGVVVNDAIVMIDMIERSFNKDGARNITSLAKVAATRLRPITVTTITTVVGVLPTAYGIAGYDSMLAEMMLAMGWGLAFGTMITLFLIPTIYSFTAKKEV